MNRKETKRVRIILILFIFVPLCLCGSLWPGQAQSGVLIPSSLKNSPDPSILSLQVMNVDVLIDNQHARVRVLQIFDSHVTQILEGKYLFALPPRASISDFAVWDGDSRIPGVILEKRRANEIYASIKQENIDPGLLQQDDEHGGNSAFSVKVFPIPAYGSKRLELEYTEILPVEGLSSNFTFPLKPSFGDPQQVGEFNLHVRVLSDYPISPLEFHSRSYPMRIIKSGPNESEYDFQSRNMIFTEDLSFGYKIDVSENTLSWISYRAPEKITAYDLRDPSLAASNPDGYFEARAIFNQKRSAVEESKSQPRNILLMLDTSLSMYGEKLFGSVQAIDYFLHSLNEKDRFNLILFNSETNTLSKEPLPATTENVEKALAFIRGSMLYGGTDLKKALLKAVELTSTFPAGEKNIVLISDANPTIGTINLKKIIHIFEEDKETGNRPGARLFAFAVGSDSNQTLLEELTEKCHGYFANVRETEDVTAQLKLFFEKIGTPSIENLKFNSDKKSNFYQVYSNGLQHTFDGSSYSFVGRYKKPEPQTTVRIEGQYGSEAINLSRTVSLPEFDDTHEHLPRLWARARVDALIREMNINGEREDYIAEIIRLSQKYKFVTPYTAFLAAPRALLRPRLIQPGDPVIRVKTDESIKSVFAVLPFGETLPLKFLPEEGVWETRFLAPGWIPDGAYRCRLLMTDKDGNGYQEEKSFVIDSHPPKLKINLQQETVRAGDELFIKVSADSDTSRLVAKLYGTQPVDLYWSDKEKANVGRLRVPEGLAAGQYLLTVTAEDFAYNQSSAEVRIEVYGHR